MSRDTRQGGQGRLRGAKFEALSSDALDSVQGGISLAQLPHHDGGFGDGLHSPEGQRPRIQASSWSWGTSEVSGFHAPQAQPAPVYANEAHAEPAPVYANDAHAEPAPPHVDATTPHVETTPAVVPANVPANVPAPGYGPSAHYDSVPAHSFDIQSFGDPHMQSVIDGVLQQQVDYAPSIDNFVTFNNTVGGPTAISTHTTMTDANLSLNHDVTISSGPVGGAAGTGWSLNVDGDGHVAVTDAHGTTTLDAASNATLHEEGVVITMDGQHVIVDQALADGGHVETIIDMHSGTGAGSYVDFETSGQGDAGLGGWVTQDHHDDPSVTYGDAKGFDTTRVT